MERCGGDRGKGFFWSIDEKHAQALEEQELKLQQAAAAAAQGITLTTEVPTRSRKRDKGALLEPPLKRSVKGDLNGTLPPPLTSAPLPYRGVNTSTALSKAPVSCTSSSGNLPVPAVPTAGTPAATGVFPYPSHPHLPHNMTTVSQPSPALTSGPTGTPLNAVNPYAALTQTNWGLHPPVNSSTTTASLSTTPITALPVPSTSMASARHVTSTPAWPPLPLPSIPGHTPVPDVVIPIVLGPIPHTHPDYTPNHPNNSAKEGYMVLHERKLILDPDVFAGLTKEMLAELEKMGARTALAVLTNHMVRALKERRAKGRGKERGGRRPRGAGGQRGLARKAGQTQFTNVSSDHTKNMTGASPGKSTAADRVMADGMEMKPPTSVPRSIPDPIPITSQVAHSIGYGDKPSQAQPGSPLIVVDDSENEEPATKKRKVELEGGLAIATH
jgi:forkhead box protein K